MQHQYSYDMIEGHIVLKADQYVFLLDTGAPSSMCIETPIHFAGKQYSVSDNIMGITPASLRKNVDTAIDGLLGTDILNQYDILIDSEVCLITLSDENLVLDAENLPLDSFMGIPVIDMFVAERSVKVFFDTGAKLSYLDHEFTAEFRSDGEEKDFYPGLGQFSTPVYCVPVRLVNNDITIRAGNLPEQLQTTLTMAGTQGILGTEILEFYLICYAPRRKVLSVRQR